MDHPEYGYTRELPDVDYETAVQRTVDALKTEGFGVLTQIDVKATMRQKLDVDFRKYVILGACNPPLAHRALTGEWGVGLLLPCNVVVMERDGGGSVVAAINPQAMFRIVENPAVEPIAAEVDAKVRRVIERV